MPEEQNLEELKRKHPCGFCNGAEGGCAQCNFTGVKGFFELTKIIQTRDKAIGQGYCRYHGRYRGDSCPDPSHRRGLPENPQGV